jgi:undecaprenyl diphosphate synthase
MEHKSSTIVIPDSGVVPTHIAIIMDGNGRWAKQRFLPRIAGHRQGVETVRLTLKNCIERGVQYLTLFAFSSENWRRPQEEVSLLMQLFVRALEQEVNKLHRAGVRVKVIGNISAFESKLVSLIQHAESITAENTRCTLTVAANYGGRWDILQATNRLLSEHPEMVGRITERYLTPYLSMNYAPEPDLFIRTGGEERISNFLLWQLAYTELYFTETLWPDFNSDTLSKAIASFNTRERRFGRTSDQVKNHSNMSSGQTMEVI